MPQDPFVTPEASGLMKSMHDLYSAAITQGFPEHIATEIITGILVRLIAASAAETPPQG